MSRRCLQSSAATREGRRHRPQAGCVLSAPNATRISLTCQRRNRHVNCRPAVSPVSNLEKRDTFRRHRSPTRSPRSRCLISRLAPRVSSRFYTSSATMTSRSTSAPAGPTRTTRSCPASLHHAVKSLIQSLTPDGLWVSETAAKWPESASAANHILIFVADSPRIRHYCEKSAI
jgi:hypothetical protein